MQDREKDDKASGGAQDSGRSSPPLEKMRKMMIKPTTQD